MSKPRVSYEQMRSFLLEALKQARSGQMRHLYDVVAEVMTQRGVAPVESDGWMRLGPQLPLTDREVEYVQDLFWDLLIEGVIRPGTDSLNPDLPWFHVTMHGHKVVEGADPTPYDPDGYLERLKASVPGVDPVIVTYLTECLNTFRINCLLSSTIALGCASEKAFLVLIAAYADALPPPRGVEFVRKTEGKTINRQYEEFRKMLTGHLWAILDSDVKENLETALITLFNVFRTHRNEAGHPTGASTAREVVYANIQAFPLYLKKVYELIAWLEAKKPLT